MSKLKIAQIGMGHDHAVDIINTLKKQTHLFEIVGLAIPDEEAGKYQEKLEQHCQGIPRLTVDEIMEDPTITAVAIETEEINLTNYALLAAQHDKQIHMDKPGGFELAAFEELIELLKEKKLVFHLGYMYRYNQAVTKLLEEIRAGELGQIFSVEAHMDCRHLPAKRQWLEQFPGGMMFFLGCHLIDLLVQIRGVPEKIIPFNRSTGVDGVTATDYGMVVFDYPNGVSFAKTCAEELGGFDRRQLVVTGSKKTVEIRPLEMFGNFEGIYTGVRTSTSEVWTDTGYHTNTPPVDRYETMMESFCKMAKGEKENPYTYDYELTVYKTVLRSCGVEI